MANVKKFIKAPFKEKLLFIEAVLFLFWAKFLLTILPFKTCIKTIKAIDSGKEAHQDKLLRIKRALGRANRLAFWRNVCLVQSFAGKWMLQRRGIKSELFIGVDIDKKKKFRAHAWLKAGGIEITHDGGEYTELHVL